MSKKYKSIIADAIWVKTGSSPAWIQVSRMTSLEYTDQDTSGTVTFVNGKKEDNKVGEEKMLLINFSDSDLATMTKINALSGEAKPWYVEMGKVNGNLQGLYIPEGTTLKKTKWKSPASNDVLGQAISITPVSQSSLVSIAPSTGLPAAASSHATSDAQTSDNYDWLWIETAPS